MMNNFCKAFGMKTYIYDPYLGYNNLSELLMFSDVISLNVHVTDETREMINKKFLMNMRKGSYLINTSRGELVDELSIIKSIKAGHLSGYGTDVIKDEFGDRSNSELVEFSKKNSNVIITPHVGGMTWEGQTKAYKWAISKFKNIV